MENYEKIKELGSGTFGNVYLFQNKLTGKKVVIKEITFNQNTNESQIDPANEVLILAKLNHPNIIQYYDSFFHEGNLHIVIEYASYGTLYDYIKNQQEYLNQQNLLFIFAQILMGLDYMHENNILHRDLKTENILLTGSKANVIKITDFGISKILSCTYNKCNTKIGTPNYLAPEVCLSDSYGIKADIWSLGCILYEMCTLERMFDGPILIITATVLQEKIKKVDINFYSKEMRELVEQMCRLDPSERPQTQQLIKNPFILPQIYNVQINLGAVIN